MAFPTRLPLCQRHCLTGLSGCVRTVWPHQPLECQTTTSDKSGWTATGWTLEDGKGSCAGRPAHAYAGIDAHVSGTASCSMLLGSALDISCIYSNARMRMLRGACD